MGRKQFFDRKNARHFRLVHRSVVEEGDDRSDGSGDENDRVFAEVTHKGQLVFNDEEEVEVVEDSDNQEKQVDDSNAGEAAKYGVYFDDRSYDYTRHLKPIGKTPGAVFIPATHSRIEEEVEGAASESRLNHAIYDRMAELDDVEPALKETLIALEDEEYICSDFEDDLIVKLDEDATRILVIDDEEEEENYDDFDFEEAEMESVIDQITDEEKDSFPTDPMAQLDLLRLELMADEDQRERLLEAVCRAEERGDTSESDQSFCSSDSDGFDCQSILSIRTNTENHPGLISEAPKTINTVIHISSRTGMPRVPGFHAPKMPPAATPNKGIPRPRQETPEERKLRKAATKEEQRLKRASKKTQMINA